MTQESPEAKKSRLLYRALAQYSNACEAPELTPSCPFYTLGRDGVPVCAEECKDILSDELAPVLMPDALDLGGGLQAIPRARPRRPPAEDRRPFDAKAIYLHEKSRDIETWSMTSLLVGLKQQFAWHKADQDDPVDPARVELIKSELARRNIDFETTVRYGLSSAISASILFLVLDVLFDHADDDLGWVSLIREVDPSFGEADDTGARAISMEPLGHIRAWIASAPLEDVMDHRVRQTAEELTRLRQEGAGQTPDGDALWLVDRFTETYISRWSQSSWQREWRYQHSQRPGCCPAGMMRDRTVDVNEIAQHLAEVGAKHAGNEEHLDEPTRLIDPGQFVPLAAEALGRGDREEAVSIFRMLERIRPGDSDVTNNLGFCLLPDARKEAIECFERTLQRPPPRLASMTWLNLAIAQFLCGDVEAAAKSLAAAKAELPNLPPPKEFQGWMWDLEKLVHGIWELVEVEELSNYADRLADLIDASPRPPIAVRI